MLTGELPRRPIDPPSRKVQIDVRLDEVVLRALEKEPERRFQTAGELKTMVETITATPQGAAANTATGNAGAPGTPRAADPRAKRFGGFALALCIVAVAAPVLLILSSVITGSSPGFGSLPRWSLLSLVVATGGICWLAALIFGIIGWRSVSGKIAVVAAALLPALAVPVGVIGAAYGWHAMSETEGDLMADEQPAYPLATPLPPTEAPATAPAAADRVIVEDLALLVLTAIRDEDDSLLRDLSVDRVDGWRDSMPHLALEIREKFAHTTGMPFRLHPSDSIVAGDRAVVRCIGPDELNGAYLVLGFVRTPDGWRNWSLHNSPPNMPLQRHFDNFSTRLDELEDTPTGSPENSR